MASDLAERCRSQYLHGRVLMLLLLDGTVAGCVAVVGWLGGSCLLTARDLADAAVIGIGIGCGSIYTVTVAVVVNIISTFQFININLYFVGGGYCCVDIITLYTAKVGRFCGRQVVRIGIIWRLAILF